MKLDVAFSDAHSHSNPVHGVGAKVVARKFKEKGGWFIALVSLSPWSYGIEAPGYESYIKAITVHRRECDDAAGEGLNVACFSGFHPADVDRLIDKYKVPGESVLELGLKVIEYIGGLCRDRVLSGIGEVGRQHYKTSPERVVIAELILEKALEYLVDYDCIIQMHLEHTGPITVELVDRVAKRVNLRGRHMKHLIFHHSKPVTSLEAYKRGYSSTIPGTSRLLKYAFTTMDPFYMVESDYIDDPHRPGVVAYPWAVVDEQVKLYREGVVDEEYLHKINIDNVVRVFEVEYS
ncbi:MAG: TatD family hydrolase [Desulfurococcales archaeon]|nr:TatD family hydrolase [Desulfurococcales archaeon]